MDGIQYCKGEIGKTNEWIYTQKTFAYFFLKIHMETWAIKKNGKEIQSTNLALIKFKLKFEIVYSVGGDEFAPTKFPRKGLKFHFKTCQLCTVAVGMSEKEVCRFVCNGERRRRSSTTKQTL